jgi:hypothetical protein
MSDYMTGAAMRKSWKTIVGSALLRLAVAGACYAYAALYDYRKPMNCFDFTLTTISMIVCPPQLFSPFVATVK